MHTHVSDHINIQDACDALNCSRTTLTRAFREELGHSPLEELQQIRFQHAQQLLKNTDMNLLDIAEASGFADQAAPLARLQETQA